MRPRFVLSLCLLATAAAFAQEREPVDPKKNQKVEKIHVEDTAVKIDETRYAGQTENITVQPKNGMPAYEILPPHPARARTDERRGTSGDRVWNVFSF